MAKKHISVTNKRVLDAMEQSNNASRLIEEAILYYLDSVESEYITKAEVKGLIMDCLRDIPTRPISNPNYVHEDVVDQDTLANSFNDILNL